MHLFKGKRQDVKNEPYIELGMYGANKAIVHRRLGGKIEVELINEQWDNGTVFSPGELSRLFTDAIHAAAMLEFVP